MAVYVDQLRDALWRHGKSCHLYADTLGELHAFAERIGMKRTWFQDRPGFPHYDLTAGRRKTAVLWGAVQHDKHQLVEFVRNRRERRDEKPEAGDVRRQGGRDEVEGGGRQRPGPGEVPGAGA